MLNQQDVNAEDEKLQQEAKQLSDEQRQQLFSSFKLKLKDPDTYAALNWFFMVGLHHFYLGKWLRGFINIGVVLLGIVLLFTPVFWLGVIMILVISVEEVWSLFRSQVIVQDWNNKLFAQLLNQYR